MLESALSYKNQYKGFTRVESNNPRQMWELLGIRIDPSLRIFEYEGTPRFRRLSLFWSNLVGSEPRNPFLGDPELRGRFDNRSNSVFVLPNDPFAECHELGHAFVQSTNPNLVESYENGFRDLRLIHDNIALYSLDEGVAQFIAIQSGLRSDKLARVGEAIYENNKLTSEDQVGEADLLYQPEVLKVKVAKIEGIISNLSGISGIWEGSVFSQRLYLEMLHTIYREAMSLGYVYTVSQLERLSSEHSNATTAEKLSLTINNPPDFAQLEQEVLLFKGF